MNSTRTDAETIFVNRMSNLLAEVVHAGLNCETVFAKGRAIVEGEAPESEFTPGHPAAVKLLETANARLSASLEGDAAGEARRD